MEFKTELSHLVMGLLIFMGSVKVLVMWLVNWSWCQSLPVITLIKYIKVSRQRETKRENRRVEHPR